MTRTEDQAVVAQADLLEASMLSLVPIGLCRCGRTTTRDVTEDDAALLTQLVSRHAMSGGSQLAMLDALGRFHELRFREAWRDECKCEELPAPLLPSRGFHLYRLWTEDGRLLYVGVSTRLSARIRTHRRRWGELISRVTVETYPDETSMLSAEKDAIRDEDPAFNRASVG